MKKNSKLFSLLFVVSILFGCQSAMDEHYKVPEWLKGSAWQVLDGRGDYTIFLKGVEIAGFRPMMEGKSILTVMAPNDAAFREYLSANGFSDISDMSIDQVKKLIGFHLLYYSYNKEKMINFRPEGDQASDESKMINAGMYYKFRSRSQDAPTKVIDSTGVERTIYHLERFLPVFSYQFFQTKRIDAKANYEFFYPNSTWTGGDGFNVSNATVKEYQIIADNGYIYAIDRVLEPLETIYTVLSKNPNYSLFSGLYDAYTAYQYDATLSTNYGKAAGVDSLYLHTHGGDLPPIANEWPTTSYQNVSILARQSFSIFAPSNAALNDFFQRYWRIGGYSSLSDVDRLAMQYLLLQFYYSGSIVFPEEITQGMVMNRYGTVFNFNPYTASDKALCVNGSFFGLSDIGTPPLFGSVAGPAFRDKNKMAFLYALSGSQMLDAYASNNIQFTLLVPSDALLLKNGIQLNSYAGRKVLEIETEDGLSSLSSTRMQEMANMHTSSIAGGLATTGKQVVPSQISFNYWYLKDGTISSSANFNNYLNPEYTGNPFVPFTEITNNGAAWNNGRAYTYSDAATGMLEPDKSDGLAYALAVGNDNRYLYSNFVKLLKCAGLVNGTSITFLAGSQRFIAFIPTNEAIEQAVIAKQIPGFENCSTLADWDDDGIDKDIPLLATYLKSYFILATNNVFTNYPYPGSSVRSGVYISGNGSTRMQYSDTGTTLNVKSTNRTNNPNVVATYDYFPFAFKDGCFHLIDATL